MNQTKKITWLIAHEPVNLFLRTAEAFREKIAELTNNQFEVEILTYSEYENKFPKYSKKMFDSTMRSKIDPMSLLDSEEIHMSQMHITEIARWHSPEFLALEMPFIFEDHDHAARVLEGPIGRKMLDELQDKSPAKGMEFTYSGGFRCIVSKDPINNLNDMKGMEFATTYNPVTLDTCEAIGAIPKIFSIKTLYGENESFNQEGNESTALETTIPRYLAQRENSNKHNLINTKHNLFLTSIIIGNKFWNTLTNDEQTKFSEACRYASRLEREWSVEEAEEFAAKADHSDIGVTYTELSAEDIARFKQAVAPLYDKYRDFFYPGLLDGIIKS
jgi:TRAP-type C4-dicarboxylate transport system substrate-binding protein